MPQWQLLMQIRLPRYSAIYCCFHVRNLLLISGAMNECWMKFAKWDLRSYCSGRMFRWQVCTCIGAAASLSLWAAAAIAPSLYNPSVSPVSLFQSPRFLSMLLVNVDIDKAALRCTCLVNAVMSTRERTDRCTHNDVIPWRRRHGFSSAAVAHRQNTAHVISLEQIALAAEVSYYVI